jgi:Spy/CpxP family protein refolding chaperone
MKTWLCALICALGFSATAPVLAQDKPAGQLSSAEWLARIQSDKKGIVAKSMDLTAEEAKKFWPLYEQFQRELALPRSAANRAILDLIAADGTLTDANAKRLVEQVQGAALDEARLNQKHFKQLLKVLPTLKAARYMQIESKLQAVVRYETAKAIPLVQ